jgi:hypothetical protein
MICLRIPCVISFRICVTLSSTTDNREYKSAWYRGLMDRSTPRCPRFIEAFGGYIIEKRQASSSCLYYRPWKSHSGGGERNMCCCDQLHGTWSYHLCCVLCRSAERLKGAGRHSFHTPELTRQQVQRSGIVAVVEGLHLGRWELLVRWRSCARICWTPISCGGGRFGGCGPWESSSRLVAQPV